MRRAHRLLAARRAEAGARQSRPPRHVLRHRLRDDGAVDGADADAREGRGRRATSRVFCNHVTIIPAIRAILDSPDMRLDAFIGPGHVSTVIGCRPVRVDRARRRQADRRVRLRAARHPAGDRHAAAADRARAAPRSRTSTTRVVPWEGNRAALRAMAEVFELRPYFEWRGLGFISQSALRIRDALRGVGRGAALLDARRSASPIPRPRSAARCSRAC